MLFEGTRTGGREDCLSTKKSCREEKEAKEWKKAPKIENAQFRSAEKSIEAMALKTRSGARRIAAYHLPSTTLFVLEPRGKLTIRLRGLYNTQEGWGRTDSTGIVRRKLHVEIPSTS
jgi:hypothetical protein